MPKSVRAVIKERREAWSKALSTLDPAFYVIMRDVAPNIWEICPPDSVPRNRGFNLRDDASYLLVQERWVFYPQNNEPIIASWRYQFSQPDDHAFSGNMEWVFRYEANALQQFGGGTAESHLNVHHPQPIGGKMHYPGPENAWVPAKFIDFVLQHFPGVKAP